MSYNDKNETSWTQVKIWLNFKGVITNSLSLVPFANLLKSPYLDSC